MEINFDVVPSVTKLVKPIDEDKITVKDELLAARESLSYRATTCEPIKPIYTSASYKTHKLAYKLVCVCPKYRSHYCCRHVGNIVVDRDMLTQEEHICHLATPKPNFGVRRQMPTFYHKRIVVPNCTSRIAELAKPNAIRVQETIDSFQHVLKRKQVKGLVKYMTPKTQVQTMKLSTALEYIQEERRLERIQKRVEKRRCMRWKKKIMDQERHQIQKLLCFIFDEMKEHLLDDQFLINEKSTLYAVILEQIREFTEPDFYTSSNLRQYQTVLANNITVWINKFIASLNIQLAPVARPAERPEPEPFLPVSDYISQSDKISEDVYHPMEEYKFHEENYEREQTAEEEQK